jgi:spore coat polysaccharide biosynthesis protein SpsF (cytidylyltransferase family)
MCEERMSTAIIVQARTGSTRLPGKVLKLLGERAVLEHVLSRLKNVKSADTICVATTTAGGDDAVVDVAGRMGVAVYRGSETDVLARYHGAATMVDADVIIRVTSDCPLIDYSVVEQLIALRKEAAADYASNGLLRIDWPHGLDCEVFTRHMLERAMVSTNDPYDHEHVTPWIRTRGATTRRHLPGPGLPVSEQRWVLDYPEDYAFLLHLYSFFPTGEAPLKWQQIWKIVQEHPEVSSINNHLRRRALPQ